MTRKFISLVFLLILFACNPNRTYENYEDIPELVWRRDYVLTFEIVGRAAEGEAALLAARRLAPGYAGIAQALTALYVQQERWKDALPQARAWVDLEPNPTQARQVVRHIEAGLASERR